MGDGSYRSNFETAGIRLGVTPKWTKDSKPMKIKVMDDILRANDAIARENRRRLDEHGIFAVNLMSSPGAGKTTLIEKTLGGLGERRRVGVIEGDIETARDSERLEVYGIQVVQLQTGSSCHLDANMVSQALDELELKELDLLIIENVGNLVCPAEFRVGEDHKVMILSVTEGDEKPLKYPLMFKESSVMLINKVDLLQHTNFDIEEARRNALKINPCLEIIELSCTTGSGMEAWERWLLSRMNMLSQTSTA
jgi:hydrogenase nickel incorporation protein HypB